MCGDWQQLKHAHSLPHTEPFRNMSLIYFSAKSSKEAQVQCLQLFPCFCHTNTENKVPINVPACRVNNARSWVNNWSHASYTFCSCLYWIIKGGELLSSGVPQGFSFPAADGDVITFPSASRPVLGIKWHLVVGKSYITVGRMCEWAWVK